MYVKKSKQFRSAFKSTKSIIEPLFLLYGVVTPAYQPKNSEILQNKLLHVQNKFAVSC